jgi:peptidylprolyl isomerase
MPFSFLDAPPVLGYNASTCIPAGQWQGWKEIMMAQAKTGDTVRVHYTGTLDDGTIFDTSADSDPLQFTLGQGRVIPGFEDMVNGMNTGESKTEKIPAARAYGPHREEMIMAVERSNFPPHIAPEIGAQLKIQVDEKSSVLVEITEVTETRISLDANHPLAGRDLTFDVQLLEIL